MNKITELELLWWEMAMIQKCSLSKVEITDIQSVKIDQQRSGGITLEVQRQVPCPRNTLRSDREIKCLEIGQYRNMSK